MSEIPDTDHLYTRIRRCHTLALESMTTDDLPFGALIERCGEIVSEATNTGKGDITGHAEINAIKNFLEHHPQKQLQECTLYSNFEPCAMCSFLIRDYGIQTVVFSVYSPHLGGVSRWNILEAPINPSFTWQGQANAPTVIGGILQEECGALFDKLNWKMHHTD